MRASYDAHHLTSLSIYTHRVVIFVYRSIFDSGSSLDDVSLASWWSIVNVTSVDLERKHSFAHLTPSETYVKAWYKLRELEVALCSACLTTDQVIAHLLVQSTSTEQNCVDRLPFQHAVNKVVSIICYQYSMDSLPPCPPCLLTVAISARHAHVYNSWPKFCKYSRASVRSERRWLSRSTTWCGSARVRYTP